MGFPLSEPAPSHHQMSTRQRVSDAHSYTCRRGSNPQRHTMLHHFRRDRTFPELHANLVAPSIYMPDSSPILSKHELPRVEGAPSPGVNDLDQLKDRLETAHKSFDVDTLVHIQEATQARNTAPLAPDNQSCLLRTHSPAGTRDVSPVEITVCCVMLPAHRQGRRRQYTPVPNAPRYGFRKSESHRLCETMLRQCNVRRLRAAAQRLIHSGTNRQRQFADSSPYSDQGPPNQGRRLSGIPLTSGLRTTNIDTNALY